MVNIVMVGAGGIARTHGSSLMRIPGANILGSLTQIRSVLKPLQVWLGQRFMRT